jgi:hypothetical protein
MSGGQTNHINTVLQALSAYSLLLRLAGSKVLPGAKFVSGGSAQQRPPIPWPNATYCHH